MCLAFVLRFGAKFKIVYHVTLNLKQFVQFFILSMSSKSAIKFKIDLRWPFMMKFHYGSHLGITDLKVRPSYPHIVAARAVPRN